MGNVPDREFPIVRAATPDDAAGIGRVQVRAWRAGYAGLMPAPYLASLDAAARARFWHGILGEPSRDRHLLVAASAQGVAGFVTFGPEGVEDLPRPTGRGEVYSLNVDPDRWGTGVGRSLLTAAEHGLAAHGYPGAVLWVMPGNRRACRFYARSGWSAGTAEREVDAFGVTVNLVAYTRDLPA